MRPVFAHRFAVQTQSETWISAAYTKTGVEGTIVQTPRLSDRLSAIAGYINNGASVADIGTDHGLLPVYLAHNGFARRIIASDISADSLGAARRTAAKYGAAGLIEFSVASGLESINETDVDTIVLAGIGGETIARILIGAPWTKNDKRLILQPQSKSVELCIWLRENGYTILDSQLAFENERYYIIMLAEGGVSDSKLEPELELMARLMYNNDPLFTSYLESLIVRTQKAVDGMKGSGSPDTLNMALRLSVYLSLKEAHEKCRQ